MSPDQIEALGTIEGDSATWKDAIRAQLSDYGVTWGEFVRELVLYAEPRLDRSDEDVYQGLGELTQVSMDLAWRETDEFDPCTDDMQLRASEAIRGVYELLSKEESYE